MTRPTGPPHATLTPDAATTLIRRHVAPELTVTAVRPLFGGSINQVLELVTDGRPASIVAKLNSADHAKQFLLEEATLRFYASHTCLPVPRPIAVIDRDSTFPDSGLLMEKIEGTIMADARLSPRGIAALQQDLAHHIAELHSHERGAFGSALEPADRGRGRWLDHFAPRFERQVTAVRHRLSAAARSAADRLLRDLSRWLPPEATPTLVHGDLWANNILVDDSHPDRPRITAFIDASANYCDPEYELAYLRVFQTAGPRFFETYTQRHPLRRGFERRCRVYWLNTMMMHVELFGDRYLPRCESLARQIDAMR